MSVTPRILVIAATERELAYSNSWRSVLCGVGPVEAAVATAQAIASEKPLAVLHVGIAGARRSAGLAPGSLVIGSEAHYSDLGVPETWAPKRIEAPVLLLAGLRRLFPNAAVRAIATSGRVGGGGGGGGSGGGGGGGEDVGSAGNSSAIYTPADVEAMEGFGVLRAAQLAGIPAIEARAISNEIEETNRAHWHFDEAFEAITTATPLLVAAVRDALRQSVITE